VSDGVTGLLVSGTDVDELAATVASLIDSAELRRRLGEAGRLRALSEFTWHYAADRVANAHARLANAEPRPTIGVVAQVPSLERKDR
jgi:glycosyltransferase involved in cell wall biosynthesis